ncbi:major facilitator superfamily protein, partial [Kipferlia bialata]
GDEVDPDVIDEGSMSMSLEDKAAEAPSPVAASDDTLLPVPEALEEEEKVEKKDESASDLSIVEVIMFVLRDFRFWLLAGAQAAGNGQFLTITGFTAKQYLVDAAGFESSAAASLTVAFSVATIISGPSLSAIAEHFSRSYLLAICGFLGTAICLVLGFMPEAFNSVSMFLTLLAYGFCT